MPIIIYFKTWASWWALSFKWADSVLIWLSFARLIFIYRYSHWQVNCTVVTMEALKLIPPRTTVESILYGRNELHFYCQIAAWNSQKKNTVPTIEWFTDWSHPRTNRNPEEQKLKEWIKFEARVKGVVLCYWQTTWNLKIPKDNRIKRTHSS